MNERPVPLVSPVTAMMRRILQLTEQADFQIADTLGLSRGDFNAMSHLMGAEPMGPSELAHRLHMTTSSATVLVDRLESMGHVVRQPDPGDRRRLVVEPTTSAQEATWSVLMPLIMSVEAALEGVSQRDQRVIARYLASYIGEVVAAVPPHFTHTGTLKV